MAALLLVMGNLADRIGHRRVLYAGLATYFVSALLAALSNGFAMLLLARFLTGIALASCYTVGPAFTIRSFVPGRRARALSVVGFERETRPFRPHLTLGRVRNEVGTRQRAELEVAVGKIEIPECEWRTTEISLVRSRLHPDGARHDTVATFPLRAPPPQG